MRLVRQRLFTHCYWILFLLSASVAQAQLTVSFPTERMVVQRNQANTAPVYVAGTFSVPVDRIEARLVRLPLVSPQPGPASSQSDEAAAWTLLHDRPQNGLYNGVLTAPAGSFRLEVRGVRAGQLVSTAAVARVGVGEVFLVAGQSNAMGLASLGAKKASERVVSFNAWNRFWNRNDVLESSANPFPVPTFSPLDAENLIFPTGQSAWCWGELGDYLADRYGVPVAFFNVAIPATVAENWSSTANGIPASNIFISKTWPFLQPYSNLRNALQYYHAQFGIRAVLWHLGESDAWPLQTSGTDYQRHVQNVIDHSRADFGRNLTWVVARCSITPKGPTPSAAITGAQQRLAETPGNNVWPGPDTDSIQSPRPDHGHFENVPNGVQGLSAFARAWNRSLTDQFFRQSLPHQPERFVQTGILPGGISAGGSVSVPFELKGFATVPNISVQLLNERGWFVTEVGRGWGDGPLRVRLPDTLTQGTYRLRVVTTAPVLAGTPSLPFRVTPPGSESRPFVDVQVERTDSTRIHFLLAQEPADGRLFVERLDSLGTYRVVGTVNTRADGQLTHLYSFTDPTARPSDRTYRIRIEQPGGRTQFSNEILLASRPEPVWQPAVYPNPNDGRSLTFRLPRGGAWQLTLTDLSGRAVGQQTLAVVANQPLTMPLPTELANGLYLLHFQQDGQRRTLRLLIQR